MKQSRPFSQILLWTAMGVVIVAVIVTGILTNTTLRSIEKNLPNTLLRELHDLTLVLQDLAEVVYAAERVKVTPTSENFKRLRNKVKTVYDGVVKLRNTYVFKNLIQASDFHAVVAPAIADLQIWLSEGVSGYGPETDTTVYIALSRISRVFQKARALNYDSQIAAQKLLNEERNRLDQFLFSVNLLFVLTLVITSIMVFLFIRQHVLTRREVESQAVLRRAERSIQESEELYSKLIAAIPDMVVRTDVDGHILFVNEVALQMSGYKMEELEGKSILQFIAPKDHETVIENLNLIFDRKLGPEEYHLVMADGKELLFEVNSDVLRRQDGSPYGIVNVCRDITARKLAEEELQKLASIVKHSSELINLATLDGNMIFLNKAGSTMLGIDSDKVEQVNIMEVIPDDLREKVQTELLPALMEGNTWEGELKYRNIKTGEVTDVHAMTFTVKEPNTNKPLFLANVSLDITERKRTEKEKAKLEAQLQRAQKMEALGIMAGGVAHDLNNVLSGIVSYPDLLLRQIPEDSPLIKPILTMQDSGKKAADIVQDLLTLARRGVVVEEVMNLNEIISEHLKNPEHDKLKSFHPMVEVETRLASDLFNISGSPVHLSKTVMNLVSNAAEAMPDGGKILVSTENRYFDRSISGYDSIEEGDYVTLTVSDTGVGISPEENERIFEPFYTKKVMGRSGTGLGMAVVWGTVKDHKGYIDVQSTEGKGTTFTLYFPATRRARDKEKTILPIENYMGKGESILVVDDVKQQREIVFNLLTTLGYLVDTVSSGEKAVDYMKNKTADLLILDMIMDPGIDGLDTYKKIIEIHPGQKAIIASGFSETYRVREAQKLGAGQYIKKPYTLGKIGIAVRAELDK
jgi:PAS domain S-box-containing protein